MALDLTELINIYEKTFGKEVYDIIDIVIKRKKGDILRDVKERLYNRGLGGDGQLIGRYHPQTIKDKKFKRQRSSFVTLRDSGLFYKGMFIKRVGDELIHSSKNYKTPLLIEQYDEDIFGFPENESQKILDTISFELEKIINLRTSGQVDLF